MSATSGGRVPAACSQPSTGRSTAPPACGLLHKHQTLAATHWSSISECIFIKHVPTHTVQMSHNDDAAKLTHLDDVRGAEVTVCYYGMDGGCKETSELMLDADASFA